MGEEKKTKIQMGQKGQIWDKKEKRLGDKRTKEQNEQKSAKSWADIRASGQKKTKERKSSRIFFNLANYIKMPEPSIIKTHFPFTSFL